MEYREKLETKLKIVIEEMLPDLSDQATEALVFLMTDFLMSLDAISALSAP